MIRKSVKMAEEVGAKVVVHHLPARLGHLALMVGGVRFLVPIYGWDREKSYRYWLLEEYGKFQSSTDVVLCIENSSQRSDPEGKKKGENMKKMLSWTFTYR